MPYEDEDEYGGEPSLDWRTAGMGGQAPPMAQGLPEGAVQLLVRREVNGRPEELGRIAARATVDDVIEKWFDSLSKTTSTTLQLVALDVAGDPVDPRARPSIVVINPAHEAFQRISSERAVLAARTSGSAAAPAGPDPIALMQMIEHTVSKRMDVETRRLQEERDALIAERRALAAEQKRIAEERIALTAETTDRSAQLTTDMLERQAKATQEQQNTVVALLSASNQQTMTQMQLMIAQTEARAKADAERLKLEMEHERVRRRDEAREREERWERERRADEERAVREAERLEREHERRMEREREMNERAMQTMAMGKGDDITKTLFKLGTVLSQLGIDTSELPKMLGGMLRGGSLADTAASVVEKVVDGVIEVKKLEAAAPKDDDGDEDDDEPDDGLVGDQQYQIQLPDGQVVTMTGDQLRELQAAYMQQQAQMQAAQVQQIPQQPVPQQPVPQQFQPLGGRGYVPDVNPMLMQQPPPPQGEPVAPRPAPPPPSPAPAPKPAPQQLSPAEMERQQNMLIEKAGRRAAKKVASVLKANEALPDDELVKLVKPVVLSQALALAPYAAKISVEGAFREAGLTPAQLQRGLVVIEPLLDPAFGIPLREADLKPKKGRK